MPKPTATDQLRTTQSATEDRHNAVSGFRVKRLALAIALGAGLGIGLAACSPTTLELIGAGHRVEQGREDVRNNVLHDGTGQPTLDTLAADSDVSTDLRPRRRARPQACSSGEYHVPYADVCAESRASCPREARANHAATGRYRNRVGRP